MSEQRLGHPQAAQKGESVAPRTKNFLINRCEACGRQMSLQEGDVLFERRWYHGPCWKMAGTGRAREEIAWVSSLEPVATYDT
jgi:hypothetical protein